MKNKKTFKEKWQTPDGKIIIKLKFWLIFFAALYLFVFLSSFVGGNNNTNYEQSLNSSTTVTKGINFSKMKNKLIQNVQQVTYKIGDYFITGVINNNTLEGTLETNANIYRIKYEDGILYQIQKEELIPNENIMIDVNISFLLPINIINILNEPENAVIKDETNRVYSFEYAGKSFSVKFNEERIFNIIINDNGLVYDLSYIERI